MNVITIILEPDGACEDWKDRKKHTQIPEPIRVIGIDRGMQSGAASVMIGIDLGVDEDGADLGVVHAQTSLALFLTAADALKAKFGDPRQTKPPAPIPPGELN